MNSRLRPLVWIGLVAALVLALVGTATAAPVIDVTKSTSGQVLAGKDSAVTVQATNTGDQFGFNVSVRDVLPAGVSYVPGSAGAAVGNPTILANQPSAGQTTLLWVNVGDISPASTLSLGYSVSHDPAVLEVGDSYTNSADVYVNTDPRVEPTFSGAGVPSNFTQSGGDTAATDIAPFELTISEPSPEGELLRGLHDHQTVYTLTLENNAVATTTNVGLEAWFPAGLEFLGCATGDNTTDAPTNPGSTEEYPGSGAINPGNAPGGFAPAACPSIASVETVSVDPPGPPPAGVYTKVVFSGIADLGIGETRSYQVVAAVPLRENTLTWTTTGGAPTAASGLQASNLDNNDGPVTAEGAGGAEVSLPVAGTLTGDYQGPIGSGANPFSDDASNTRVAEDLRIRKSVDGGGIAGDRLSDWTLKIDTSEYRFSTGLTVTDTVPDGLCPVGVGARCPDAGPPPDPYASATEAADGSWTVTWNQASTPALAQIGPSGTTTITLRTYTRDFYQEDFADDAPILANDSWSNSVALTGTTNNICTGGTGPTDCAGGSEIDGGPSPTAAVSDSSSAGQSAPGPTIDKQIGTPGLAPGADPADRCDPANATYGAGPLNFGPSDLVCYRLTVNFPASVFTGQELGPPAVSPAVELPVADFLPTISGFVAASQRPTAANTVTITDTAGNVDGATDLLWNVSSAGAPAGTVDKGGVFDITIGAQLDAQPDAAAAGLQLGNLMKYANVNSGGQAFTKRDQVFLTWSSPLEIVKGVALINGSPVGGYPPPQDNKLVEPGDVVTYEIDLTATGGKTAEAVQVWDVLPPQIGCGQVGVISDSGVCNASVTPNRIEWNPASAPPGLSVPPGTPKKLRYDVLIPEGLGSGTNLDNTAGVRQYRETSNTGTAIDFIPSMNIDPSLNPSANTVPIKDPSRVRLVRAKIAKSRTTSIVEPGNSITQATIGERIDYTLTTTVPANTTLFVPEIRDALSARNTYVAGSAEVTLPSGTTISGDAGSAEGWTLSTAGGVILLQNPTSYANTDPTDQLITITFSATVDDEAANVRGGSAVPNATSLTWFVEAGGAKRTKNANVSTPIVEPNVAIGKGNSAAGPLQPGGAVDFTVTASNPNGPNVSVAHDLVVRDVLPSGVTAPTAISGGGLYDAPTRTITWNAGKLDPGASVAFTYSTTVGPSSALSQGLVLQNTATATVTSLAGAVPGERTAATAAALGVPGLLGDREVVDHDLAARPGDRQVAPDAAARRGRTAGHLGGRHREHRIRGDRLRRRPDRHAAPQLELCPGERRARRRAARRPDRRRLRGAGGRADLGEPQGPRSRRVAQGDLPCDTGRRRGVESGDGDDQPAHQLGAHDRGGRARRERQLRRSVRGGPRHRPDHSRGPDPRARQDTGRPPGRRGRPGRVPDHHPEHGRRPRPGSRHPRHVPGRCDLHAGHRQGGRPRRQHARRDGRGRLRIAERRLDDLVARARRAHPDLGSGARELAPGRRHRADQRGIGDLEGDPQRGDRHGRAHRQRVARVEHLRQVIAPRTRSAGGPGRDDQVRDRVPQHGRRDRPRRPDPRSHPGTDALQGPLGDRARRRAARVHDARPRRTSTTTPNGRPPSRPTRRR